MSQVEFIEETNKEDIKYKSREILGAYKTPRLAKILMRLKIAKDEQTAYIITVVIVTVCFIGAVLIFTYAYHVSHPQAVIHVGDTISQPFIHP